jgi:uncharacterized protein Smg (DUF494 family)
MHGEPMKDNARDLLTYLFHNYRAAEVTDAGNRAVLRAELAGAGFAEDAVRHVLSLVLMTCVPRLPAPRLVRAGRRVH